jgi:hypothetical protein
MTRVWMDETLSMDCFGQDLITFMLQMGNIGSNLPNEKGWFGFISFYRS